MKKARPACIRREQELESLCARWPWLSSLLGLIALGAGVAVFWTAPLLRLMLLVPCGMLAIVSLLAGVIALEHSFRKENSPAWPLVGAGMGVVSLAALAGVLVWTVAKGVTGIGPSLAAAAAPVPVPVRVPAPPQPAVPAPVTPAPPVFMAPIQPQGQPVFPKGAPPAFQPPPKVEPPKAPVSADPPAIKADLAVSPERFPLPGQLLGCTVGGGGRWLILHIAEPKQLLVFDVATRRATKSLTLNTNDILVAAGYEHLMLIEREPKLIHRYAIETLELELTATIQMHGTPGEAVMGSASADWLLVTGPGAPNSRGDLRLIDAVTLTNVPVVLNDSLAPRYGSESRLQAPRQGGWFLFTRTSIGGNWQPGEGTACTLCPLEGEFTVSVGKLAGDLAIDADGRRLSASGSQFSRYGDVLVKNPPREWTLTLPAVDGPYELRIAFEPGIEPTGGRKATIHATDAARPLVELRGVQLDLARAVSPGQARQPRRPPVSEQLYLFAEQGLVVNAVASQQDLWLYPLAPTPPEILAKTRTDYLYLASSPRPRAVAGKPYRDRWVARSGAPPVKFALDLAPPGMRINAEGVIEWQPPTDAKGLYDAVVTMEDAAGRTLRRGFQVTIGPRPQTPKVVGDAPLSQPKKGEPNPDVQPAALTLAREAGAVLVVPPKLPAELTRIPLPGAVRDVVVGGGGRFLILQFENLRNLAIFDVNEARIVHYLDAGARPRFAACLDKLLVYDNDTRTLSRFDLLTRQLEQKRQFPEPFSILSLTMGSASNGPALATTGERQPPLFLDVATLKTADFPEPTRTYLDLSDGRNIRASANGRVFTSWKSNVTPSGVNVVTLDATGRQAWRAPETLGPLAPTSDGTLILGPKGYCTQRAEMLRNTSLRGQAPAVQGPYTVDGGGGLALIYARGLDQPLARLEQMEFAAVDYREFREEPLPLDKRLLLIAEAQLLIAVAASRDALVLRKFDPAAALEAAKALFVSSIAPPTVSPGDTYQYQMTVVSAGEPRFRLLKGPDGMEVTPAGVLTWKVSDKFRVFPDMPPLRVEVQVQDAGGKTAVHAFDIQPVERRYGTPTGR